MAGILPARGKDPPRSPMPPLPATSPAPKASHLGPVSRTLLDELLDALTRKTSVVWVDAPGHYTGFFDKLGEALPANVQRIAYRGSYLELLPQLVEQTSGAGLRPTLLHAPGLNTNTIRETPLLALYAVSHGFERALPTLIKNAAAGRVRPDDVEEFLSQGEVTLERADAWMASRTAEAQGAFQTKLAATPPGPLLLDLLSIDPIHRHFTSDELKDTTQVRHRLALALGFPDGKFWTPERPDEPASLGDAVARWVMAVEYVDDLTRPPYLADLEPATRLSRPLIQACKDVAVLLRERAPEDYRTIAQEFTERLGIEKDKATADDLGSIDTFPFEEKCLREDAIKALQTRDWTRALERARARIDGGSVWLRLDRRRDLAWKLIHACAELGCAIDDSTKEGRLDVAKMFSLSEAADAYAQHGAPVDLLHRKLEEAAAVHLLERLPEPRAELALAIDVTRHAWRTWAETLAEAWTTLCENEGALPSDRSRCQRRIFVDTVEPYLTTKEPGKTAYFMVDAFRFEMATELRSLLGKPSGTNIHLHARLSELPSVTEVGMNVLAPLTPSSVSQRLTPTFKGTKKAKDSVHRITGWKAGGSTVSTPDQRVKAMSTRITGSGRAKLFSLEDVVAHPDGASLKNKLSGVDLVVVHSVRIDKAGENGSGLAEFSREIRRLKAAWDRLRDAGVRRFVITADHGFLLRRPTDPALEFGQYHDAKGRYAMYPQAFTNEGTYSIRMSSLDYDDVGDHVLVFPRSLQVFQAAAGRDYVHGGNSPQERVIPLLTVEHKRAPGGSDASFDIEIRATSSTAGRHTLEARLVPTRATQLNLGAQDADVALELQPASPDVTVELYAADGATLTDGLAVVTPSRSFQLTFGLRGPREERVPVSLIPVSGRVRITKRTTADRFDVRAHRRRTSEVALPTPPPPAAPAPAQTSWLDEVEDVSHRQVLAHIETHGAITEVELQTRLGPGRPVRRFARSFERYKALAPFLITIESTAVGRTYKKASA